MTDRTVLDVVEEFIAYREVQMSIPGIRQMVHALGVDPDMPFDKFKAALSVGITVVETPERAAAMTDEQRAALNAEVEQIGRRLNWGERAEKLGEWSCAAMNERTYGEGWNDCLSYIKRDD